MPNGSAPLSEIIKEEEHHAGPELQRTGRSELVNLHHLFAAFFLAYLNHIIELSINVGTSKLCKAYIKMISIISCPKYGWWDYMHDIDTVVLLH